ncbi:hypothetical protein P3602_21310 [Vibrio parahaemolyticus]|uniref:hypothetical protein n=1 Tax=Vibrio TaxID=662 RepID=UPI001B8136F7|nr:MULTISPECIES: hypothetical protein [Vibrio]MCA2420885.1 hypothetical protein [Vibrio alginolyticus]MCA2445659.1 hypothetical protein [Vibrio alginolyticus]MDF5108449.1 hypothetical protein [Vibrio parahaemolyticus]MDF5143354.1 hypothetical protein [Vibrio parahaemolyticus]MDF5153780.1 hypothetical protein [Vibrio parahaemolyticus]
MAAVLILVIVLGVVALANQPEQKTYKHYDFSKELTPNQAFAKEVAKHIPTQTAIHRF